MSIRLDTLQTVERNVKAWCRHTVPLICLARYLSDRPIDWFFFWIGLKCLRSSKTYLFDKNETDEDCSKNKTKDHRGGHQRFKGNSESTLAAATRNASSTALTISGTKDGQIPLTALPSVVLSNIACYLHPKDVVDLETGLRSGMASVFRARSSEVGSDHNNRVLLTCRKYYDEAVGDDMWKRLWYRDYGDVLLKWKVSREVFHRSLVRSCLQSSTAMASNSRVDGWLEEHLSNRIDKIVMAAATTTMKDFYFLFGECYIDYILARKNAIDECFVGLHGHIFDFTDFAEYHPGLIEPVLAECGCDATYYFEDITHSSGARNIARRLCVLVNHSVIDDDNSGRSCGLELVREENNDDNDNNKNGSSSQLKQMLRTSNTRPPPPPPTHSSSSSSSSGKNTNIPTNAEKKKRWMSHVVPRRRQQRKLPTLERIRKHFEHEQHEQDSRPMSTPFLTTDMILFRKQRKLRLSKLYYDPFRQEWIRWSPEDHEDI